MKPNNQPQSKTKSDYSSLFICAVLLLVVGLGMEATGATPIYRFFEGVLIGMSIACSVIGFVVYTRSSQEKVS